MSYTFAQRPRAVQANRPKFREPVEVDFNETNIMWDRRVLRGNTYGARLPSKAEREVQETYVQQKQKVARARQARSARMRRKYLEEASEQMEDVEPVDEDENAEQYLEELTDPITEQDFATQTEEQLDAVVDVVQFVPKPRGVNQETMVEEEELFEFEEAVEPLLEVLVGKCMHQGLMEVLEEEARKVLTAHRQQFEQERNLLLAEAQALDARGERRTAEKERRLVQQKTAQAQEEESQRQLEARAHGEKYVNALRNDVVDQLENAGAFFDPTVAQIEQRFLPWITEKVARKLQTVKKSRRELDALIHTAIDGVQQEISFKAQQEQEVRETELRRLKEEEERLRLEEEARVGEVDRLAEQVRIEIEHRKGLLLLEAAEAEGAEQIPPDDV